LGINYNLFVVDTEVHQFTTGPRQVAPQPRRPSVPPS
jgi:hypothetical protein